MAERPRRARSTVARAGAALGLVLGGCAALQLVAPRIDLVDVGLENVGLLESVVALELRIENPNPFRLPIERGVYTFFLDGARVGRGATRGAVDIPANGSTRQQVVIAIDNVELLRRLQRLLDDEVGYRIEAEHVVRGFGGRSLRSVSEGDIDLRSSVARGGV